MLLQVWIGLLLRKNTLLFQTVCKFRRLEPSEKDPSLEDIPLLERPELGIYDHIYSLEDNTMYRPQGDMQVILKYDVEGKWFNQGI